MQIIIDHDNATPVSTGDKWTPKLNGDVFCSSACGSGCKKADFDRATELAGVIAAKLGRGWIPRVWENLGWHFEVKKGAATVSLTGCGDYSASIEFSFNDRVTDQISEIHSDPRIAVQQASDVMNNKIASLKRALMSVTLELLEIEDV